MKQFSHEEYEIVERAVSRGTRICLSRNGREFVVIPLALRTNGGREAIATRNPVSGHEWTIFLDEIERVEAVG